jgi:hypothetical protein
MFDKPSTGVCTICTCHSQAIEWHHTIPRAFGGEDSLQIPLCSDCHGLVHKKALAVYSFVIKGKTKPKQFWTSISAENNAQQYVELIVNAMLDQSNSDKQIKVRTTLDTELHRELNKLKIDMRMGSLENAIRYCIQHTLEQKGFVNERQENQSKARRKTSSTLWSMRGLK